ncbi:hypothetical protein [Shewanella sp.]|uniref:hypothetical protein n=2 Tax=Shewanella sp. TaxID=50422 RepID=UPI00404766EF
MKSIQMNRKEVQDFVLELFADGKTPSERFGMTWASLSQLERNIPELTCKVEPHSVKTA